MTVFRQYCRLVHYSDQQPETIDFRSLSKCQNTVAFIVSERVMTLRNYFSSSST